MSSLSPEELRELRRVHVHAGRRVDSLFAGNWRSAVRGQGMEFEEVRAYHPGDDIRHIDWNVTARTNEPAVKVFREERQLTVILAVDVSGSTKLGSGGPDGITDRRLQIARIAGSIAYAGIRNRDQVGLVTFTDHIETILTPRKTRGHVWKVISTIFEAKGENSGTDIAAAAQFISRRFRRKAVVVLVSDFLDPSSDWRKAIGTLSRRHDVHALCVTDPMDQGLPDIGIIETVDPETGKVVWADSRTLGAVADPELIVRDLRRKGARAAAISTSDDPFAVLHRHFSSMGRRR